MLVSGYFGEGRGFNPRHVFCAEICVALPKADKIHRCHWDQRYETVVNGAPKTMVSQPTPLERRSYILGI